MIQKTDFKRVMRSFIVKHDCLFGRADVAGSVSNGVICETLIEGIVRADLNSLPLASRRRLFRVFYLLTKCMRYSELQMYHLMSKYADDDSIIHALECDNMKFFVNLFDIISMGWRHDGDVCSFLYRDWHEGSTIRMPGGGYRFF